MISHRFRLMAMNSRHFCCNILTEAMTLNIATFIRVCSPISERTTLMISVDLVRLRTKLSNQIHRLAMRSNRQRRRARFRAASCNNSNSLPPFRFTFGTVVSLEDFPLGEAGGLMSVGLRDPSVFISARLILSLLAPGLTANFPARRCKSSCQFSDMSEVGRVSCLLDLRCMCFCTTSKVEGSTSGRSPRMALRRFRAKSTPACCLSSTAFI
mmetsp:Transcript_63267/g.135973  ORF Transcript_63267/g.135973 Transcript_63267/m.135973 type:complete len:212 (-) Transcript_63267:1088-1723(-)